MARGAAPASSPDEATVESPRELQAFGGQPLQLHDIDLAPNLRA